MTGKCICKAGKIEGLDCLAEVHEPEATDADGIPCAHCPHTAFDHTGDARECTVRHCSCIRYQSRAELAEAVRHAVDEALGCAAFEAYGKSTGGKTYDGRPIPAWSTLPERIREAWIAAARAAVEALE